MDLSYAFNNYFFGVSYLKVMLLKITFLSTEYAEK